jgi:alpha-tubulin suppressor-like RCC1 family protein
MAYCWGNGPVISGPFVSNSTEFSICQQTDGSHLEPCTEIPQRVSGGIVLRSIEGGLRHVCGLTAAGEAYCWGANDSGQLGDGTRTTTPAQVRAAPGLVFRSISAGVSGTCGIAISGITYCWGSSSRGELGVAPSAAPPAGTPVAMSFPSEVAQVVSVDQYNCALTTDGRAFCAGINGSPNIVPVAPDYRFSQLSGRLGQFCGLTLDGTVRCNLLTTASAVDGAPLLRSLSAGIFGAGCGMGLDGFAYCWNPTAFKVAGQP